MTVFLFAATYISIGIAFSLAVSLKARLPKLEHVLIVWLWPLLLLFLVIDFFVTDDFVDPYR